MRGRLAIAGALGAGLATVGASLAVGIVSLVGVPGWVLTGCALGAGVIAGLLAVVAGLLLWGQPVEAAKTETHPAVLTSLTDLVSGRYSELRLPPTELVPDAAPLLSELGEKLAGDRRGALAREDDLRKVVAREVQIRRDLERELLVERASHEGGGVQDVFLSRMSHELRTPLNAVLGYAEMLIEEEEDTEARDDLSRIRSATLNLLAMVTSVLDLTQLHSGDFAVAPESVLVGDVVDQVIDATRLEAESHGDELVVHVEPGLMTHLDRRMLHSILFNLVSNACKYTHRGEIRVRVHPRPNGKVRIEVADTGIGMTERQVKEAFEPFQQADGTLTRRYDGSGLGLAVVRGFAEAMGGTVNIRSTLGKGATVVVDLPRECEARVPDGIFDEDEPTMLIR